MGIVITLMNVFRGKRYFYIDSKVSYELLKRTYFTYKTVHSNTLIPHSLTDSMQVVVCYYTKRLQRAGGCPVRIKAKVEKQKWFLTGTMKYLYKNFTNKSPFG